MMQMMAYFYIYSMVGWTLEVIYDALTRGVVGNPGMLYGPLCPIYGFGMMGIIRYMKLKHRNTFWLFAAGFFIASVLELVTGILVENIFHRTWWNYSDRSFNLGGYICLSFSMAWALAAILMVKLVHPLMQRLVEHTPKAVMYTGLTMMSLLLVIDTTGSANMLLRPDHRLEALEVVTVELRAAADDMANTLAFGVSVAAEVRHDVADQLNAAEERIWRQVEKIRRDHAAQDDWKYGESQLNAKADEWNGRTWPGIRLEAADPLKSRLPVHKTRRVARSQNKQKNGVRPIRC